MLIRLKQIVLSWDFIIAVCLTAIAFFLLADELVNTLCKEIYNVGISVLSIVFSVYFAALAIIISSSDDEFVRFLEEVGDYSKLIATFKYTLFLLFAALMYSIALFSLTSIWINDQFLAQPKIFMLIFVFFFPYSLFAAVSVTFDAIQYAKYRSIFVNKRKK